MQIFINRAVAALLLFALAALVLIRGIIPTWSKVDTDFPNYFTAAKIVADGGQTEKLYDDAWFQEQMHRYRTGTIGKFSPFPPPTALLLLPLASFTELTALRIMTVI